MAGPPAGPHSLQAIAGRHVLLGVAGGVAAYKAAGVARSLLRAGATVQAVLTPGALEFVGAATFAGLTGRPAYSDVFSEPDRVLHVRLAREADVAVFAPATANLLAKFATGLADDLVTSAFACLTAPVVLAPAMHTEMWLHHATRDNVALLRRRGAVVVGPDEGPLAGGDEGLGRLADENAILRAVAAALSPASTAGALAGRSLVVTAGGTREPLDPVRYLGNRSSGKMGYALAAEAARRGAAVDLVSAPTALPEPPGVTVTAVETALQMREAVLKLAGGADAVIKAAAVADFRPAGYSQTKLRKDQGPPSLTLEANPDILAELGAAKPGPILVGFAAETEAEEQRGLDKLRKKQIDLVVVNRVDAEDAGFNVDTNRAVLLGADGLRVEVPLTSKAELAGLILDHVQRLLGSTEAPARSAPGS